MCFSVNVNLIKEELENRYGATLIDRDKYRPSYYYHAFALPEMPAVCASDPDKINLLRWGLIPSWVKTMDEANEIRMKTFNARYETAADKAAFAASLISRRCLIPVRGFYEWQHTGAGKIPWYIYQSGNDIMSLAGLYDQWTDNNTGEVFNTFTILTTDANEMMAEIHNSARRMPVVLEKKLESSWLDMSLQTRQLTDLLKPCDSSYLKAHRISPLVNSKTADKNTPEIIKEYNYPSQATLF